MSERITAGHVAVQVETARTDVWVPDGLATATRAYQSTGIAYDLARGLAVRQGTEIVTDGQYLKVWLPPSKDIPPLTWIDVTESGLGSDRKVTKVTAGSTLSIGPALAQTRVPVPVAPGMQVSMSGQFKVRQTGSREKNANDAYTQLYVVAALFGLGTSVDEYGVSTEVTEVLVSYEQMLQDLPGSSPLYNLTTNNIEFTIPQTWATVPEHVDTVHLAIFLRNNLNTLAAGTYVEGNWWRRSELFYFHSPMVTSTSPAPLRIHVRGPAAEHPTYPHPLSTTGYAFRNRTIFENITPGVEVVAMGEPAAAPLTIAVHAWSAGTGRGAQLTTITVPTDTRVVTALEHTGAIELVSAATFYVESVLAPVLETDTVEQTRLHRYTYTTLTDPVVSIKTDLTEAELGISTIRFVSDTVSAAVVGGKRVRVLGLHTGGDGYTPLITGTVRGRRLVHDLTHAQQVEISVHDDWHTLGAACPVAYDQPTEYGKMVHRIGAPFSIDGVDYTGPSGPLPNGFDYFPSYHSDGQTLRDALLMTRNTSKGFLFVDRRGRLHFDSTLPDVIDLELSDLPEQGDLSYSTGIEIGYDTKDLVNVVQVSEHMLDAEDFVEKRWIANEPPTRFGPITAKVQTIDYRRASSVDLYGESKVQLPVVRGSGAWADVRDRNFGESFAAWAAAILDTTAVEREQISTVTVPVRPRDVRKVAALQPFSVVVVRLRGQVYVLRVRSVAHEIDAADGRWTCTLDFAAGTDRVYWLPDPPAAPELPVVGGFYNDPGAGSYDGGSPAGTGVGTIDGGEA